MSKVEFFDHTVTNEEMAIFAEGVLGKVDLSPAELLGLVREHPVAWSAWTLSRNYTLSRGLVGKEISLDVSTGEVDAGNRVFGTITEVRHHRNEFIVLADESSRNFDQKRLGLDAAIGGVVWKYIDRMNDHCDRDPAERILEAFTESVNPHVWAAIEHIQLTAKKTHKKKDSQND